jgi:hypothetical protein
MMANSAVGRSIAFHISFGDAAPSMKGYLVKAVSAFEGRARIEHDEQHKTYSLHGSPPQLNTVSNKVLVFPELFIPDKKTLPWACVRHGQKENKNFSRER